MLLNDIISQRNRRNLIYNSLQFQLSSLEIKFPVKFCSFYRYHQGSNSTYAIAIDKLTTDPIKLASMIVNSCSTIGIVDLNVCIDDTGKMFYVAQTYQLCEVMLDLPKTWLLRTLAAKSS